MAYSRTYTSDEARAAVYQDWLHYYNHHRTHGGIKVRSPIERVHNVSGSYT
jgi:transposase InsO family protein